MIKLQQVIKPYVRTQHKIQLHVIILYRAQCTSVIKAIKFRMYMAPHIHAFFIRVASIRKSRVFTFVLSHKIQLLVISLYGLPCRNL